MTSQSYSANKLFTVCNLLELTKCRHATFTETTSHETWFRCTDEPICTNNQASPSRLADTNLSTIFQNFHPLSQKNEIYHIYM